MMEKKRVKLIFISCAIYALVMTSEGQNIMDTIFTSLWLHIPLDLQQLFCFPVLSLHLTQLVVLKPPAHLAAWQRHIPLDLQDFVSLQIFTDAPRGRDLCWELSRLVAASTLRPWAFSRQRLPDIWRVHRCFKFLKNCPGNAFFQQSSFEAGFEYHFKKRKERKKKSKLPFPLLRKLSLTWKWKRE